MRQMGTREATVVVLLVLLIILMAGTVIVYKWQMPNELCMIFRDAFEGVLAALMIALNVGPRTTPPGGGNA